jgi:hypothetical protein
MNAKKPHRMPKPISSSVLLSMLFVATTSSAFADYVCSVTVNENVPVEQITYRVPTDGTKVDFSKHIPKDLIISDEVFNAALAEPLPTSKTDYSMSQINGKTQNIASYSRRLTKAGKFFVKEDGVPNKKFDSVSSQWDTDSAPSPKGILFYQSQDSASNTQIALFFTAIIDETGTNFGLNLNRMSAPITAPGQQPDYSKFINWSANASAATAKETNSFGFGTSLHPNLTSGTQNSGYPENFDANGSNTSAQIRCSRLTKADF